VPNVPVVQAKPFFKSKTVWANVSALAAAAGAVVMGEADWQTALMPAVMAIMNIVLRVVTKQPLE
jgi:hypothetical protein